MSVIRCDVVAKNKVLFSGELYNVMVPGTEGELGIMENHEPFVSALKDGVIWARRIERRPYGVAFFVFVRV